MWVLTHRAHSVGFAEARGPVGHCPLLEELLEDGGLGPVILYFNLRARWVLLGFDEVLGKEGGHWRLLPPIPRSTYSLQAKAWS